MTKMKDDDLEKVAGGLGVLSKLGSDGKSGGTGSFGPAPDTSIPGGSIDPETEEQPEGDQKKDLG